MIVSEEISGRMDTHWTAQKIPGLFIEQAIDSPSTQGSSRHRFDHCSISAQCRNDLHLQAGALLQEWSHELGKVAQHMSSGGKKDWSNPDAPKPIGMKGAQGFGQTRLHELEKRTPHHEAWAGRLQGFGHGMEGLCPARIA